MKPSELIRKYGWAQGAMVRLADGRAASVPFSKILEEEQKKGVQIIGFCIRGAIEYAYEGTMVGVRSKVLDKVFDKVKMTSFRWNDRHCQSKEEAIALLESIGE